MTHPEPTESDAPLHADAFTDACAVLGVRLARAVRRRSRTEVAEVLAEVPDAEAMMVALAAMVPVERPVRVLLAWTHDPGVEPAVRFHDHGTDGGYAEHRRNGTTVCPPCAIAHTVTTRPKACRDEFARLRAIGVPHEEAALLSTPSFLLAHRQPDAPNQGA